MRIADEQNLDLVEISPNAAPPVCRILDYQKFLYQKKRKEKEQKANSAKVVIKEIRFGPQTDEHDYNFKLKHAQEFLKDISIYGSRVQDVCPLDILNPHERGGAKRRGLSVVSV